MLLYQNPTAILPDRRPYMRHVVEKEMTTALLQDSNELVLVVRGMIERIKIKNDAVITFGRFPYDRRITEIDLTPYGAETRGVSRVHAQIHIEDDDLYITDLESANGTHINGERLCPNTPYRLAVRSEVTMGRLAMRITFQ